MGVADDVVVRQPIAHWLQARFFRRTFWKAAELIWSMPSNWPSDQLRVGIAPATSTMSTRAKVPSSCAHMLAGVKMYS